VIGIAIEVERFVLDAQPGFVAFTLVDANGKSWSCVDKVPVIGTEALDAQSTYPRRGWIACTIVERRVGPDGRERAVIDTSQPWGIAARTGETRFEVLAAQLEERTV